MNNEFSRLIELERNELKQEVEYQRGMIKWMLIVIICLTAAIIILLTILN